MNKLEQIKQKIQEYQNKSAVTQDLKAFLSLVVNYVKTAKDDLSSISKDNLATISQALKYIEQENKKVIESVSQETKENRIDFVKQVKELKDLIAKVKTIKPIDGKDADEEVIVTKVLANIKPTELDTPVQVRDKLETLQDNERLDKSAIKGLDNIISQPDLDRAISILDQRTQFLINRQTTNTTTSPGGGAVDSVNGQTGVVVLDTDDISDTATNRYTNDTDITRLANTSGTNTGDQTITLSGDVTGSGATNITTTIANGAVDIAMLSATGTPDGTTYLRGDNTWATISAGGLTWGDSITSATGTGVTIAGTGASGASLPLAITTGNNDSTGISLIGTGGGVDGRSLLYLANGASQAAAGYYMFVIRSGATLANRVSITDFGVTTITPLATDNVIPLNVTIPTSSTQAGIDVTGPNNCSDGASLLKLSIGNTQTNQLVGLNVGMGTSGNTLGVLVKGTGSTTGGDAGIGKNHMTLWGNTASNSNKALSIGNETSYTERFNIAATGIVTMSPVDSSYALTITPTGLTRGLLSSGGATTTSAISRQKVYVNHSFTGAMSAVTLDGNGMFEFTTDRNENNANTRSNDFAHFYAKRAVTTSNAGANYTEAGAVAQFVNESTQTSGTLTNTVDVLKLVQDTNSTGKIINGLNEGTSVFTVDKSGNTYNAGTLDLGHATANTLSASGGVLSIENVAIPTVSSTSTLTNKRIQPRTASSTTASNLSPDLSSANVYYRTTQTATLTIDAPTGTPVIGETIMIYVDSAGSQTLTSNCTYIPFGVAFPATTTAGKTFMMSAQFNGTNWKTLWANAV